MARATLTIPGFNGGDPVQLTGFEIASGLRASGGGRTGRLAGWSGRFELDERALADALAAHLERSFEEGHSGVGEIVDEGADGAFRFTGVAVRHRAGSKFAFDAFTRVPI